MDAHGSSFHICTDTCGGYWGLPKGPSLVVSLVAEVLSLIPIPFSPFVLYSTTCSMYSTTCSIYSGWWGLQKGCSLRYAEVRSSIHMTTHNMFYVWSCIICFMHARSHFLLSRVNMLMSTLHCQSALLL